jgi:hypothetical protein
MNRPKSDAGPRGGGPGVSRSDLHPQSTAHRLRPPPADAVILRMRPAPAGPDHYGRTPEVRLRLLLKHCLRLYGWRVVTLDVPPSAPAGPGKGGDHGR